MDELVLYQAPKLMGMRGAVCSICRADPAVPGPKLNLKDVRMLGQDIRITAKIA